MQTTDAGFDIRIRDALADERVRGNFRRAMDGLMQRRLDLFPDPQAMEALRQRGMRIRARALSHLPELLEQLEAKLARNGIIVHWAETVEEANHIVLAIMHMHDATSIIKGKSMVSEEMGLNDFLIDKGIDVLESDLGEFILQLAGEPPSHIVAPAIHKDRVQVAELFREKFRNDQKYRLGRVGRFRLNRKFGQDVGEEKMTLEPSDFVNAVHAQAQAITKANAPKAPCVAVWESPQTTVIPGRISPCSAPITCTIPCRTSSMPNSRIPNSRQLRSRVSTCRRAMGSSIP